MYDKLISLGAVTYHIVTSVCECSELKCITYYNISLFLKKILFKTSGTQKCCCYFVKRTLIWINIHLFKYYVYYSYIIISTCKTNKSNKGSSVVDFQTALIIGHGNKSSHVHNLARKKALTEKMLS